MQLLIFVGANFGSNEIGNAGAFLKIGCWKRYC